MDEINISISLNDLKENSITLGFGDLSGGVTHLSEYMAWRNMLYRCENPNGPGYKDYGGRGIKVCPEWHSFAQFLMDMGMKPGPDYELERIDNDGNYEPGNCRWALKTANMRNRRDVKLNMRKAREIRMLSKKGYSVKKLSEKYGVTRPTIQSVIKGKTWKES